jgi:gliding motility-associated-like protein
MKYFYLLAYVSAVSLAKTQTLIINELSNGANGSKEYVEFLVIPTTSAISCNPSTPPCLDLRGWMYDDNNGDHGAGSGSGIAPGTFRFSQNSIWSCIPIGTIIVLYNDTDKETSIPADDASMSDGNFRMILPGNSPLIESLATSFTNIPCGFPNTGWTAGTGNWSTQMGLANAGDCGRVVNSLGCEVFSVCFGNVTLNQMIYFAGNGSGKVYAYGSGLATSNVNWSEGITSPSPSDQTPGTGNNAANNAYITTIRNATVPSSPVIASATTTNASCTCTGSASASATGSTGPYTYQWQSATFISIGQNTATASNLCVGTYNVIVTSNVGCKDTVAVTISAPTNPSTVQVSSQFICAGESATLTAVPQNPGGTFSWSPGGATTASITVTPSSTTVYNVTYILSGCSSTAQATVNVTTNPTAIISSADPLQGDPGLVVTFTNQSLNSNDYTWNFSNGTGTILGNASNTTTQNFQNPGIYIVEITAFNGLNGVCADKDSLTITINGFNEPTYILPTIFTPNEDGINDIFTLNAAYTKSVNVQILNRWGEKIAELSELNQKWDGKNAVDGVYFYTYEIVSLSNDKIKGQGFIELLR